MDFWEVKLELPACYEARYIEQKNSNRLLVSFESDANDKLLISEITRKSLKANKIILKSVNNNYFIHNPRHTCQLLSNFILSKKIKKIILCGSIKSGLASLLWGNLLREFITPNINITVLAFDPISIFPENKNLNLPSYSLLLRKAKNNQGLEKNIKKYGSLDKILKNNKVKSIIFCSKNMRDHGKEALYKAPSFIKKIDMPCNSIIPFLYHRKCKKSISMFVDELYFYSREDRDLASTIPSYYKRDKFISEIEKSKYPYINDLLNDFFDSREDNHIVSY